MPTFTFKNENFAKLVEKLSQGYVLQIQGDNIYPISWADQGPDFDIPRDQWVIGGWPTDESLEFEGTPDNIRWFKNLIGFWEDKNPEHQRYNEFFKKRYAAMSTRVLCLKGRPKIQ